MITNEDKTLIFTPYITLKNGKKIYAYNYGKKVFAIWVKPKQR